MPLERYEILLPLKYNDGTPIEPEKFQQTRKELVEKLCNELHSIAHFISSVLPKQHFL